MMLTRRTFLATSSLIGAGALAQTPERLNFIVILVDDLGATDFGCYGSRFYKTPNIDKLAAAGMRFTQAYSACTVCSPSRAAVLTGKYPARLHVTDWIAGHDFPWARLRPPDWTKHLPLKERTIAEELKAAGYATASIGKWHLTPPGGDPAYLPERQGFDRNAGGTFRGQPPSYFSPYGIETLKDGPAGEYLTDREMTEAIRFIDQHRDEPFFVYLPHYAVHTPLQAKPETVADYRTRAEADAPQRNATYAAMIDSLDENLGRLTRSLDETGLAQRTVVILTSDNGGLIQSTGTNLGLRAGKGSAYEGGVRVPFIVHWPGVVKAGSVCDVPVIGIDIFPTILEIAGVRARPVDGVSIAPLLRQEGKPGNWSRDTLFWHYPHYHPGGATPYTAMRRGDWRLIEFHEDGRLELYNLRADPEEKQDLAKEVPGRAAELLPVMQAWRKQVSAQMPLPNPGYDAARALERPPPPRRR